MQYNTREVFEHLHSLNMRLENSHPFTCPTSSEFTAGQMKDMGFQGTNTWSFHRKDVAFFHQGTDGLGQIFWQEGTV